MAWTLLPRVAMAPSPRTKNRWLIALSAVAVHMSIGSAYAYSVFRTPFAQAFGWSNQQTSLAFSIAIFFLGASAALFGQFVERRGPRVAATTAAVLFASGLALSGLAVGPIELGSIGGFPVRLVLLYLGYGVVGGMGLGIGYISPVSTLVKWFPDRRGMATGMAVLGFGAGALVASPLAQRLMGAVGLSATFYVLAAGYLVVMLAGALYLAKPPEGWSPAGLRAGAAPSAVAPPPTRDLSELSASEAPRTARFWLLWGMMFVNISAGIMILSVASPLAQAQVGMSPLAAAAMVGMLGVFNGAGRIGWASLSDYVGRSNLYVLFFAVQAVAFLLLPRLTHALSFELTLFLVLSMYGGGFAALPAFLGDLFGTKQLSAIHGLLLTSWSLAGVVGPQVVAYVRDTTGGYAPAFHVFSALLGVGLLLALTLKANVRALHRAAAAEVRPAGPTAAPLGRAA